MITFLEASHNKDADMTLFCVEKIVWEFGENYGHVYHPKHLLDLKEKIDELNTWGREKNYPFFISLKFNDGGFLGFTVAHEYSLVEFNYYEDGNLKGPFYVHNPDGKEEEIIPVYYFSSYSEPDTRSMLPLHQVLEAVFQYIEHTMFPACIKFNDEKTNEKFVASSNV